MSDETGNVATIEPDEHIPSRIPRARLTDGNQRAIAWLEVIDTCKSWEIHDRLGCSSQQVLNALFGTARHEYKTTSCQGYMKELRFLRLGLQRTNAWRSLGGNEPWKRHAKDFIRSLRPSEIRELAVWLVAVYRSDPYTELVEFSEQCDFKYVPFPSSQE